MTPSIDTAKKLAALLETTVGYLLGETEDDELLKDPQIVQRLKDIQEFSEQEKNQVYFPIDAVIREIKNRKTYAFKWQKPGSLQAFAFNSNFTTAPTYCSPSVDVGNTH